MSVGLPVEEIRASHVPGPWSVGHVRPQGVHKSLQPMYEAPIHVGEGATRGNCHTIVYGGGPGAGSSTEEDVRANARLIAAAPDLLAGAKAILAARSGQASIDAIIQLRDAIAKAEGRS